MLLFFNNLELLVLSTPSEPIASKKPKRHFSEAEKKEFCLSWKHSGLRKSDFCRVNGISEGSFHGWYREFFQESQSVGNFSPLIMHSSSMEEIDKEKVSLKMTLPNQTQLCVSLAEDRLISFIVELCHATTIIR